MRRNMLLLLLTASAIAQAMETPESWPTTSMGHGEISTILSTTQTIAATPIDWKNVRIRYQACREDLTKAQTSLAYDDYSYPLLAKIIKSTEEGYSQVQKATEEEINILLSDPLTLMQLLEEPVRTSTNEVFINPERVKRQVLEKHFSILTTTSTILTNKLLERVSQYLIGDLPNNVSPQEDTAQLERSISPILTQMWMLMCATLGGEYKIIQKEVNRQNRLLSLLPSELAPYSNAVKGLQDRISHVQTHLTERKDTYIKRFGLDNVLNSIEKSLIDLVLDNLSLGQK